MISHDVGRQRVGAGVPFTALEQDGAVERAAYLGEQLQSTLDYLTHLLESSVEGRRTSCASLLEEVALLEGELQARATDDARRLDAGDVRVLQPAGD